LFFKHFYFIGQNNQFDDGHFGGTGRPKGTLPVTATSTSTATTTANDTATTTALSLTTATATTTATNTATSLATFAGKVGCWHVKTGVKTTDMCLSGQHVANMLANMLAT
jgi:hypothetical protein